MSISKVYYSYIHVHLYRKKSCQKRQRDANSVTSEDMADDEINVDIETSMEESYENPDIMMQVPKQQIKISATSSHTYDTVRSPYWKY